MSNWSYVAVAYTAVWGGLALYALVLARRVTQAQRVSDALRDTVAQTEETSDRESAVCDTPPAP